MGASFTEELIRVRILSNFDRYFQVGASMRDQGRVETLLFLIQNIDMFALSPYKVPRVDPEFIVHKLNVDPSFPPRSKSQESQLKNT